MDLKKMKEVALGILQHLTAELIRQSIGDKKFVANSVKGATDCMYISYINKDATFESAMADGTMDRTVHIKVLKTGTLELDYRMVHPNTKWELVVALIYSNQKIEDLDVHVAADIYEWAVDNKIPQFNPSTMGGAALQ